MRKNQGSISVFAALILLVVLSSIFLLIDGVRIIYGNTKIKQTIVGANEHILANYHRELQQRYHLFLLDPAFIAEKGISEEIQSYFEKSICNSKEKNTFYPFQIQTISIVKEVYLDEENLAPLKHQIREYMKYKNTTEWTKELLKKMTILKDKDRQEEETKALLEQQQKDMESQIEEIVENPNLSETGEEENILEEVRQDPREVVTEVMNGGILRVVFPSGKSISSRKITRNSLPSNELKNMQGQEEGEKIIDFFNLDMIRNMFTESRITEAMNNIETEAMTISYIMDCFSSFSEKADKNQATKLNYEIEYIIHGGKTDKENLENIVNRILLFRFGTNFSYALTDPSLNAQALSISVSIAGLMGFAPIITALKTMILAAVSYGEAIIDVRSLLSGNKIPVLKNASNWTISIERIGQMLGSKNVVANDRDGMSYEDFLKIFLLAQSNKETKYGRMLDLMEENIKIKDKSFSIMESVFGYEAYCEVKLPILFRNGIKIFKVNRSCSY
ncbi:MAG: DUF5702 domain-containing protein [Lachnospiraceae bacterium]